ncbi:TPA: hypothetical protein O1406_002420 [Staphylococcus aureus]|uniref:hypothetical protein n=1 Tax=Staphylococcus aureus TaxID=1280 RepID=UPI0005EA5C5E|nr:hypothetical protein [Staphylococcus aureus]MDU0936915.1 hypothetical protein [Dermabacter sp.]CFH41608.1 Uncharacterised protein [Staphylococcus aureus]HCY7075058.1 hypothetical protein [Staphylococcus aureus]HDY9569592.1 hypothetical protein [Staphylococcus argenteus]
MVEDTIKVKEALEKAKSKGKGMEYFGVLGLKECIDIKDKLDELGVQYKTTAVAEEGDLTPYDIYVDVNTYK